MNGSPKGYRLERVVGASGRMFAYRFVVDDAPEPDHRLCAPCWNGDGNTVVLHEYGENDGARLQCPLCKWEALLERRGGR